MMTVGIRELKSQLSAYLPMVKAGEVVLVTDRGEVVAELRALGTGARLKTVPRLKQLPSNSASRNPGGIPAISHWASGWRRKISIRPARESDNVGTKRTFAEPVSTNRPGRRA